MGAIPRLPAVAAIGIPRSSTIVSTLKAHRPSHGAARSAANGAASRAHRRHRGRLARPGLDADARPYDSLGASLLFHSGQRGASTCERVRARSRSPFSSAPDGDHRRAPSFPRRPYLTQRAPPETGWLMDTMRPCKPPTRQSACSSQARSPSSTPLGNTKGAPPLLYQPGAQSERLPSVTLLGPGAPAHHSQKHAHLCWVVGCLVSWLSLGSAVSAGVSVLGEGISAIGSPQVGQP
jgi:hypothetical protein